MGDSVCPALCLDAVHNLTTQLTWGCMFCSQGYGALPQEAVQRHGRSSIHKGRTDYHHFSPVRPLPHRLNSAACLWILRSPCPHIQEGLHQQRRADGFPQGRGC